MDIATTSNAAPLTNGTSGNDRLLGGDEDDVVYGQGGNDGISGGNDQDLLEGNANGTGNAPEPGPARTASATGPPFAGDVIHGDAGADDVGGGTGRIYRMVAGVETQDPRQRRRRPQGRAATRSSATAAATRSPATTP